MTNHIDDNVMSTEGYVAHGRGNYISNYGGDVAIDGNDKPLTRELTAIQGLNPELVLEAIMEDPKRPMYLKMHPKIVAIIAGVMILVLIILIIGVLTGYIKISIGKQATTSTYTSSLTPNKVVKKTNQSKFGNHPNWYMQDGCAGYNCSTDISNNRSLGFGIRDNQRKTRFNNNPSTMNVNDLQSFRNAQRIVNEFNTNSRVGTREHMTNEQQSAVLADCDSPWDPMATEEAKVLNNLGVYKGNSPSMASFSRAVNDNIPLTDAQLELIMQGGEPYVVAPMGIRNSELMAAQARRETTMTPARAFK